MKQSDKLKHESEEDYLYRTCQEAEKESIEKGFLSTEQLKKSLIKHRAETIRKNKNAA